MVTLLSETNNAICKRCHPCKRLVCTRKKIALALCCRKIFLGLIYHLHTHFLSLTVCVVQISPEAIVNYFEHLPLTILRGLSGSFYILSPAAYQLAGEMRLPANGNNDLPTTRLAK